MFHRQQVNWQPADHAETHHIVPSFAVGSAVGLRGFMSYIFGASLGTSLFGVMVDKMGWHGGFYLLMGGIVCCILFCLINPRRPTAEPTAKLGTISMVWTEARNCGT